MPYRSTSILIVFFALHCATAVLGQTSVVIPNANATAAASPDGNFPSTPVSGEIQTVYDPSQFPSGPVYITGLALRAAPGQGPFTITLGGSIYLSTSPNWPNSNSGHTLLSTTLASNVGPDNTLVLSGNNITMNGSGCAGPAPCPFAMPIVFTSPFFFNPAKGPLLLDLKATAVSGTGSIDGVNCSAPCFQAGTSGSPLGATTGSAVGYGAFIIEFTYASATQTTTSVNLNFTATSQVHTNPNALAFEGTGSVGSLGNATLYVTSPGVYNGPTGVLIPPVTFTGSLIFDQNDAINLGFSVTDINIPTEQTFSLSGGTITGGTGAYAGATGSLSLTFTQTAGNVNGNNGFGAVYGLTGSGSVTAHGTTTALTLKNFPAEGNCPFCTVEYNTSNYAGTAGALGNATLTFPLDVTNSPPFNKIAAATVQLNPVDSFNFYLSFAPSANMTPGSVLPGNIAGGTGVFAGANGTVMITEGQTSSGTLTITGSATITTIASGTPLITSVKTAFGAPYVAYNTWLQINGTNLAPANTPAAGVVWSTAPSFQQNMMPSQLGPITVTVNGLPAYIFFYCSAVTDTACTSGDQINVLAPLDTSFTQYSYPVEVVVTNNGVSSAPFSVLETPFSPTFPWFDGAGHVVARHLNFNLLGPASLFPGASTPATVGEEIILVLYGLGAPNGTAPTTGSATQTGVLSPPQCWISGIPVAPGSETLNLISPGLYQLNLVIPPGTPSGDNPINCAYQGYPTFPGALISVQ
jgi:uncharacterized protein (TIGR03437 family)